MKKLNVIVVCLLILVVVLFILLVCAIYALVIPKFALTDADTLKNMEIDAADLTLRLEQEGVKHSAACGTLLGSKRWKFPIPWDDDLDFYYHVDDYEIIKSMFPDAKETPVGFTIISPNNIPIDLFELRPMDHEIYGTVLGYRADTGVKAYEAWRKREFFTLDEWDSISKTARFGDTVLYGPEDAHPYLSRAYSPKYNKEVIVHPKHDSSVGGYTSKIGSEYRSSISRFPNFLSSHLI